MVDCSIRVSQSLCKSHSALQAPYMIYYYMGTGNYVANCCYNYVHCLDIIELASQLMMLSVSAVTVSRKFHTVTHSSYFPCVNNVATFGA